MFVNTVECRVIKITDSPRSSSFLGFQKFDFHFKKGYVLHDNSVELKRIDQHANKIYYGRELTLRECGCLLSHLSCYEDTDADWLIVFEDDAQFLQTDLQNVLYFLSQKKFDTPSILLLGYGDYGVFKNSYVDVFGAGDARFTIHSALAMPTGAYGYAINRRAMNVAIKQSSFTGTADWPVWISQVSIFAVSPKIAIHPKTDQSTIYQHSTPLHAWPKHRSSALYAMLGQLNPHITRAYGGTMNYFKINLRQSFYRKLTKRVFIGKLLGITSQLR